MQESVCLCLLQAIAMSGTSNPSDFTNSFANAWASGAGVAVLLLFPAQPLALGMVACMQEA